MVTGYWLLVTSKWLLSCPYKRGYPGVASHCASPWIPGQAGDDNQLPITNNQ
jgi:hypothetical protein